jgi:hypothetical protein
MFPVLPPVPAVVLLAVRPVRLPLVLLLPVLLRQVILLLPQPQVETTLIYTVTYVWRLMEAIPRTTTHLSIHTLLLAIQ